MQFDEAQFYKLGTYKMPFGRYAGIRLIDIPEEYFIWFKNSNGYPDGELGEMMQSAYEIKVNGLEYLFKQFK